MEAPRLTEDEREDLRRYLSAARRGLDAAFRALDGDPAATDVARALAGALEAVHAAVRAYVLAPSALPASPVAGASGARFAEDAVRLAHAARGIARTVLDDAALRAARAEPDELRGLVETAFVTSINLRDFEDPSWPRVRREHLNHGDQIVAGPGYCLYGEARFGGDLPEDIRAFPKLVD